jgi:dolichol kinase
MVFGSFVAFSVIASAAVALFIYWSIKKREPRNIWLVALAVIVSGVLTAVIYSQYLVLSWFFFICVAVATLSAMLPLLYRRNTIAFMLAIFIVAYAAAISFDRMATIGMFGIGTVIGALYSQHYLFRQREDKTMRKTVTEMKRDVVQVSAGLAILVLMLLFQQSYTYIIFWIILLGYLFNNLISKGGLAYRKLAGLERRDSEFGIGAMHLAAGMAIILGFASYKLALFGVFPLFFGDALATLTGLHFYRSRKLPYNRRKSYAGTIAFFIATVVPGVILLGIWGIILAVVLTIVESVELPIDDNVALPIATVIIGAILGAG